MLGVFRGAGFAERATFEAGVVRVTTELDPVPAYLAKVEERDRRAAVPIRSNASCDRLPSLSSEQAAARRRSATNCS